MQTCPICNKTVEPSQRYPRYVCVDCAAKATAKDGRALVLFNESFAGGYVAQYADTKEPYDSHECYINGIKCHADEHYFGGIVIQPIWLSRR